MNPATIPGTAITVALQKVTPEAAAEWLSLSNEGNRRLRPGIVAQIARDIQSDAWKVTHQGIAFDERGRLLDGQHRLSGIVQSGQPVSLLVFSGVPSLQPTGRKTIEAIDGGAARSLGDQLHLAHGIANGNQVAAILSSIARNFAGLKESPTVDQTVRLLSVYPDLPAIGALRWKKEVAVKAFTSTPVCAAAVVAHHFNPRLRFYGGFLFGIGLKAGSGAITMRNTLLGEPPGRDSVFRAACNAILAEIDGRTWPKYDDSPEGRNFLRDSDPARWKKVRAIFRLPASE